MSVDDRLIGAQAELEVFNTVSQDLPLLATDALAAGLDTQTLRVLAGEPSNAFTELDNRDLFRRVVHELGRQPLPHDEALWQLVRFRSGQICGGLVGPLLGAQRIERLAFGEPAAPDIAWSFMALREEALEDWGRSVEDVEAEIIALARRVFDSSRPSDLGLVT